MGGTISGHHSGDHRHSDGDGDGGHGGRVLDPAGAAGMVGPGAQADAAAQQPPLPRRDAPLWVTGLAVVQVRFAEVLAERASTSRDDMAGAQLRPTA
jgi:hypothetical protein